MPIRSRLVASSRWLVPPVLAICVVLVAMRSGATILPGGGPKPDGDRVSSDCYTYADVVGTAPAVQRKYLRCTDGDATCDQDMTCNGTCRFRARLCTGLTARPGSGLAAGECEGPPELERYSQLPACPLTPPMALVGSVCGAFVNIDVPLRGSRQQRAGRTRCRSLATAPRGVRPRTDTDVFVFVCLPREGGCPASPSGAFLADAIAEPAEATVAVGYEAPSTGRPASVQARHPPHIDVTRR